MSNWNEVWENYVIPTQDNTMFHTVHLGRPQSKERPRRGPAGNFYTPKATQDAEDALRWTLRLAKPGGVDSKHLFSLWTAFYVDTKRRVDGDNFLKLVMDAGNLVVWHDDAQVLEMHAKVIRGDANPRTEITVCVIGTK